MRSELLEARRRQQIERDQALQEKEARQRQERLYRLRNELGNRSNQDFAIYQLTQIGGEAIETLIDGLLTDDSTRIRYGSARALGQICDAHKLKALTKSRVVKALIKALGDPEPAVRYRTAEALGNFKGQAGQLAVEPLGTLLKDRDEDVRRQARSSLQKIGGKRAQEILDRSKGVMGWLKGNG
jgi:HEAT repeat protein